MDLKKHLYGYFKWQTGEIAYEKIRTWLWKGNFKRETESLLIAAQNNTTRTNHIKAKIDNTQEKNTCRFWGDWNETIYHIVSECSKLVLKKYKTKLDWVRKVIHCELCKRLNFDYTTN